MKNDFFMCNFDRLSSVVCFTKIGFKSKFKTMFSILIRGRIEPYRATLNIVVGFTFDLVLVS